MGVRIIRGGLLAGVGITTAGVVGAGVAVPVLERGEVVSPGREYEKNWSLSDLLSGREEALAPLRARIEAGELVRRARTTRQGTMDIGEIAVLEDDGTLVSAGVTNSTNIVNAFYATHPDDFDEVIIFVSANFPGDVEPEAGFAFYSGVSGHVAGINAGLGESSEAGGINRLKGLCNMNDLPEYPADLTADFLGGVASGVEILGQEFEHAYGAFVQAQGADILGRGEAHWSFFLNHGIAGDASPMEGNRWVENGGGSFTTVESFTGFGQLDEYVMGLRAPAAVDPFWLITFAGGPPFSDSSFPTPGINVTGGTRVDLTINDIIALNGARQPDTDTSQKVFRVAFIMVIPQGTVAQPGDLSKINAFRTAWETYFFNETEGLGSMDTTLAFGPGSDPFTFAAQSFESGLIDPAIWEYNQGATISTLGANPPSGTQSLRLNGGFGGGDEIRSRMFDLSAFSPGDVTLDYSAQRTGNGNSPELGEDLQVDYWNNAGNWVTIRTFAGDGPDETAFTSFSEVLPADALHNQFRFRFHRLQGSASDFDDFFVDDVALVPPPACIGDLDGNNTTDVLDFAIFSAAFGTFVTPGTPPDYDADGQVTVLDFATWVGDFGCGT